MNCHGCGKEITRKYINKKVKYHYCSRNCYHTHRPIQTKPTHTCVACGKEFTATRTRTRGHKYCSRKCYFSSAKNPARNLTCAYCGKEFTRTYYVNTRRYKIVFCNRECHNLYRNQRSNKKMQSFTCNCCGKQFERYDNINKPRAKYCSWECMKSKRYSKKIQLKCAFCGKDKVQTEAQLCNTLNRTNKKNVFCDRECFNKYIIQTKKKTCKYCGKEFNRYGRKLYPDYCSKECFDGQLIKRKQAKEAKRVPCSTCGKLCYYPHAQIERTTHHYCSEECKYASFNSRGKTVPIPVRLVYNNGTSLEFDTQGAAAAYAKVNISVISYYGKSGKLYRKGDFKVERI